MKKFALFNYQFEKISEPENELKLEFPDWKDVDAEESFQHKQEIFQRFFPVEAKKKLPFEFWSGNKFHIHKLVIPPTSDGIVLFNLSNKKQGHLTNEQLEKITVDDYRCVLIVIDNRPGVQRILIEQNQNVFREVKTVALILQKAFNHLLAKKLLKITLYSEFPPKEFWDEVDRHPEGIRKVVFHLPPLNLERLTKVTEKYLNQVRDDWNSGLDFSFTAQNGGVVQLDRTNERQQALIQTMSITGVPTTDGKNNKAQKSIVIYTAGDTKQRISIGEKSPKTIQIPEQIILNLSDIQLKTFEEDKPHSRFIAALDQITDN